MNRKRGKGWCAWTHQPTRCPAMCGSPAVDNFGKTYPACALVRIKSKEEIDALLATLSSAKASASPK
jgi:hypothetical protein